MAARKPKFWGSVKPPAGTQVDWGDPISNDLVSYWLMGDNGGIATDIIRSNQAHLEGSATWGVGTLGNCLKLSTDAYAQCPTNASLAITGPLSISC